MGYLSNTKAHMLLGGQWKSLSLTASPTRRRLSTGVNHHGQIEEPRALSPKEPPYPKDRPLGGSELPPLPKSIRFDLEGSVSDVRLECENVAQWIEADLSGCPFTRIRKMGNITISLNQ